MKTKSIRSLKIMAEKGYSIIEVMLTLVVVGVGILAIVQLQSSLSGQVGDNKAKAEATMIAEARIEELRNYTNKASTLDEFDQIMVASSVVTIPGVNADFDRIEKIEANGDVRNVSVTVSWSDRIGDQREITVTSEIAYVAPESSGQNSISYATSIDLNPATGIAKPGDGEVSDLSNQVPNGDGTYYVIDGNNKYLTDAEGKIQLILEGVCQSDGTTCTENFTRIHGRVYIDRRSYLLKDPLVEPVIAGAVNVVASNSAYCTRIRNSVDAPLLYEKDIVDGIFKPTPTAESVVNIDPDGDRDTGNRTPNGDYEYFDYTCYVSRGWYGNIGVYVYYDPNQYGGTTNADSLSRATQTCMGDPAGVADLDDGLSKAETYGVISKEYALSTYRAYRGMIYTDSTDPSSTRTIGIAGGRELGLVSDSETVSYKPNHNFVISYINSSATVDDCLEVSNKPGPLKRTDSNDGLLFSGVVDDFVCLNTEDSSYLDDYDKLTYSADYCPLDPTTVVVTP